MNRWLTMAGAAGLSLACSPAFAAVNVFACLPEWASLATELGGDKVSVYQASNALQDPHRIEARPSLVARMRSADLVFAFPPIILAMVVAAVLGRGLANAALAIVVVAWPSYSRVVRGLVLSVGDSEYVQSSRLLGASSRRTLLRDVVPNVAGPVFVLATLDLANAILLLSGLSFLGLGAQPPRAEWGSMVAEGTQYFQWWWIGTFPGLAIFTVVLAFNFLGDSLRDVLDPQSSWRAGGEAE